MDYSKKRWGVLIAACLIGLCIGALYTWSTFATPMAQYLSQLKGQKVSDLSYIYTIACVSAPIDMIIGGFLVKKFGAKVVAIGGGILFGLGMILSGFVTSAFALVLTYGIMVGVGTGFSYGIIISNTVKFFPERSGFAGGLVTTCFGASSIIFSPIANALIEKLGVLWAFRIIGFVMLVIIIASAFFIITAPESECVVKVDLANASESTTTSESNLNEKDALPVRDVHYKEMLKTSDFYLMLLTMLCGSFAGMMVLSQTSQIAQNMIGFEPAAAALVVSVVSLFNMFGRFVLGWVSDKIGQKNTLMIAFGVSLVVNVILYCYKGGSFVIAVLCLALIGFCYGGNLGIFPSFTQSRFGRKYHGVNYGLMYWGTGLAGVFGPMAMSVIVSKMGIYQPAFLVAAAIALMGEAFIVLLKFKK